ncbi:Glycerol-3-phosphate acyltransferase 1, mitochondrial [Merluccius polli]|uniref:Glycerol-3-phosphate acyltransferase 1, mitochondrial n=1 Tax=Merluccius polli TaxID=89951 RepID=A0AA47M0T9_MERPO|nr:Glycerol-3-phosphate acyltransferase 1, mitochondrial [Merluccius polli]
MKTEERHFASMCAEHFMHVAREWNVEDKVSTDSARNMIAASKVLPFEHMPCTAHLLQRQCLYNTAHLIMHWQNAESAPNSAELEQQQVAKGKTKEVLTPDVSTRWNSTLEMIRRILRNQEPLRDTLALHATKVTMPTAAELDKLQKLEAVLEPCRYITELLGGEKFLSYSVVLPALCHLSLVMEVSEDDPAYMVKFKETFTAGLEQRKDKTNMTWLRIATALDPRFTDLKCLSKPDRAEVWRLITALLRKERSAQQEQPAASGPPKKRLALLLVPVYSSDEEEDCFESCVERYKAEPTIDTEDCPQQWWSNHEGAHSMMARLARKYLATPATSVPCERLFSLTLIRKLGGFFIRRKMDETGNGKKDVLYRSLLHAYTEELLRQQQFLEVYLEGTRSRSGKPSPARAGMLSIVVDTLCTGAIPDVLVVPVGISYDRILEGNYNSEQLGKPKKNESLWGVACGVFRMLRKNYGCVRVDFTQPFSLKEYLDSQRSRNVPPPPSLELTLVPIIISAQPDAAPPFENPPGEEPNGDLPDEICRRHVISNLAKHVLFTANKSSAVMSTHIVACLLLYRHRQGVVLSKLVEDFFNMKEEILSRDFDLGFSGNSEDVVMHALHLLGNCVNVTSSSNRNGEFTVAPSNTVPALFELNFYSNGLFHVFIADAVIACWRCSGSWQAESQSSQEGAGGVGVTASCTLLSQERLIRKAAGLAHFLTNEVAVAPPCQTVYQVFHDAVARLIQYGVLYVAEEDQEELSPSPTEEPWPKKFTEPLSWRSDEEDEDSDFGEEQRDRYLKVSTSLEHQEFFVFLQRLLSPVLEAYSGAAILVHSLKQPVDEREYTQQLFRYLLTRTERGVAAYGESATHYLVKNTVKTFKELGVLKERRENRVTTLELSTTFLPQVHRSKLLHYILAFILL